MELKLGDVQTTALIPLAVKAKETMRHSDCRAELQSDAEERKTS